MPDPLLSELCAICHIRPHKYCCPRCSVRTCSLPCVKRHKQWSQCNGARDPTVYMKRSHLATPRGIDHDYNYLTSIERQLDTAERDANYRGLIIHDATATSGSWKAKRLDGPKKGEEPMRKAFERCGVIVERAPNGMSRRKHNATHWHKRKKQLQWTIEWIHNDGRPELGSCSESTPIADAYATQFHAPRQELDHDEPPRKRRKEGDGSRAISNGLTTIEMSALPPSDTSFSSPSQIELATKKLASAAPIDSCFQQRLDRTTPSLESSPQEPIPAPTQPPSLADVKDVHLPTTDTTPIIYSLYYYLHAPRLPSQHPVLIPLLPEASLSESLRGRLVLEFPTIFVLAMEAEKLPDRYITEEMFFKKLQQEGYRDQLEAKLTGQEEGELGDEALVGNDSMDERTLQEVLERDLTSLQEVNGQDS